MALDARKNVSMTMGSWVLVLVIQLVCFTLTVFCQHDGKVAGELFQKVGDNMCPYLLLDGSKMLVSCWRCGGGKTHLQSRNSYVFDCCPGYTRFPEFEEEGCIYVEPTWMSILDNLKSNQRPKSSDALRTTSNAYDLINETSKEVYTVFIPINDEDISRGEINFADSTQTGTIDTIIAKGRWYSTGFENKMEIPNEKGGNLKISTYSNGLVFVECHLLQSPDHEATNGLIHLIDGTIPATYLYPNVVNRLQSVSEVSEFLSDLPRDLYGKLIVSTPSGSKTWYTIFAPTNSAWRAAKQGLDKTMVDKLVANHILDRMICSGAITRNATLIGPNMAQAYLGLGHKAQGYKVVIDACNGQATFTRPDLMAANGVVHVISKVIPLLESNDLQSAVQCLSADSKNKAKRIAKEIKSCNLNSKLGAKFIFLLPDDEAFQWLEASNDYKEENKKLRYDSSYKCNVMSYHLLYLDKDNDDVRNTGVPRQQKAYSTSLGRESFVVATYALERDGTKLFFNHAEVRNSKPLRFRDGFIYFVKKVNIPPIMTVMDVINSYPEMDQTALKMQAVNFNSLLKANAPKQVFLASINKGWKKREIEAKYSPGQTKKLLLLHTIPMSLFGGDDGFIWRETITSVESLLPDGNGGRVKLIIRRNLDGNTFIGHDHLPDNEWSLVLKWNKVGYEGNVWIIDWPLKCPPNAC